MNMIDLEKFLRELGLERPTLEQWIEREWVTPAPASSPRAPADIELSEADVARVIFIRDLRSDFGVNDEGVEIVLHLVDQLHGLRRAMRNLRVELRGRENP